MRSSLIRVNVDISQCDQRNRLFLWQHSPLEFILPANIALIVCRLRSQSSVVICSLCLCGARLSVCAAGGTICVLG